MTRVFIGIKVSEVAQRALANWQRGYQKLPVRWMALNDLHVTLVPPFEAADTALVADTISAVAGEVAPFALHFHRISYGPKPRSPRLIWVEGMLSRAFTDLRGALMDAFDDEERTSPKPHITIARFRPETFSSFGTKQLNEPFSFTESVSAVTLFETPGTPRAARRGLHAEQDSRRYTVLDTIPLR